MSDKPEKPVEDETPSEVAPEAETVASDKEIVESTSNEHEENNSDKADKEPVHQATESKPVKPRRGFPWFGVFNLILIIALTAAAAYYWQLQQKTEAEKQAAFNSLKQQIDTKAEASQVQSKLRPVESGLAELIGRFEQLQQHQQETQESTEKLYELFGRDENGWQLAEVEYLMRIAQHKLILENDFEGAAITLQAASDRIATTGDMGLLPVRVKISDEIAELKTRRRPDLVGMTLKLAQLGQQVRSLQPGFKPEQPAEQPVVSSEAQDKSLQERIMTFFKSLVSVKRDVDMAPTRTEALVINVAEKLEDNLKLTRWTVLERDAFQYRQLMQENLELFRQFYNLDDAANHDFFTELQALQQTEIKPEKPDISGSLQMLKKIISKRENSEQETVSGDGDNV